MHFHRQKHSNSGFAVADCIMEENRTIRFFKEGIMRRRLRNKILKSR